jgi:hypothetical protein
MTENLEVNNNAENDGREIKKNIIEQQKDKIKEKVAIGMVQSVKTEVSETWFSKISCGCE